MSTLSTSHALAVEWASAGRAFPGQLESGDLCVVQPLVHGALVAVIDGLGHGREAAQVARQAGSLLRESAGEELSVLVRYCHEGLRKTRGVVMSLASFNAQTGTMSWIGVGNVEGTLCRAQPTADRARVGLVSLGGVVGYQLPTLRATQHAVAPGDVLVVVTDGIRSGFDASIDLGISLQALADGILDRYGKASDDACVLVARYMAGRRPCETLWISIGDDSDVVMARKRALELAREQLMSEPEVAAVATAVSEVARNIVIHARPGEIGLESVVELGRRGVRVVARDHGPGMAEVEQAMRDGFSTSKGLGLGLSSAKRLMDEFELSSSTDTGTTIIMTKWVR